MNVFILPIKNKVKVELHSKYRNDSTMCATEGAKQAKSVLYITWMKRNGQ